MHLRSMPLAMLTMERVALFSISMNAGPVPIVMVNRLAALRAAGASLLGTSGFRDVSCLWVPWQWTRP